MKKVIYLAAVLAVTTSLVSCKKDTCTIFGFKVTCEEAYEHKCSKTELEEFQNECKAVGGTLSSK